MAEPLAKPARIIVRGLNWLGDAVMCTPAIQRLREAFPAAHIALLTPEKLADLWRSYPHVNEVITFGGRDSVFQIGRRVRSGAFDAGVVFPNSPKSALELFVSGVRRRYGIARPWRNFLLTDVVATPRTEVMMRKKSTSEVNRLVATTPTAPRTPYPESAHHAFRYLHLAAAMGASGEPCRPRLTVTEQEVIAVRKKFSLDTETAIVGINPGAEYGPAKRWPIDRFIEAARRIHAKAGNTCWIFGGAADRELGEHVAQQLKGVTVRSLAGETSLRELCAALKACSVVVTNDTGPMHVAAAVGTPVIVPFGSTSPELTGPGFSGFSGEDRQAIICGDAPCAPCFRRTCPIDLRCLKDVSVEQVVDSALRLLARPARDRQ